MHQLVKISEFKPALLGSLWCTRLHKKAATERLLRMRKEGLESTDFRDCIRECGV